jgi:hypothetical protein
MTHKHHSLSIRSETVLGSGRYGQVLADLTLTMRFLELQPSRIGDTEEAACLQCVFVLAKEVIFSSCNPRR